MKKILKYVGVALCAALILGACSRKAETSQEEEGKYEISTSDSISILSNTNEIMTLLQQKDVEGAANKLYVLNMADTTVSPIGEVDRQNLANRNKVFPVVQFEVFETDFREPLHNAVVYEVAFAEPDPETGMAPKTKMAFNIINLDGKMYVTNMDKSSLNQ